jgi:hypothetical protein
VNQLVGDILLRIIYFRRSFLRIPKVDVHVIKISASCQIPEKAYENDLYSRNGRDLDLVPRKLLQVVEGGSGFVLCQYVCGTFPWTELGIIFKHIWEDLTELLF